MPKPNLIDVRISLNNAEKALTDIRAAHSDVLTDVLSTQDRTSIALAAIHAKLKGTQNAIAQLEKLIS